MHIVFSVYWGPHRGCAPLKVNTNLELQTRLAALTDSENRPSKTSKYLLISKGGRGASLLFYLSLSFNFFPNFQEDGRRMSEENGGIATTGRTRRTKRGEGRGRERGRETRVTVETLITGTKRSTGIAGATTRTQSRREKASYSSAVDKVQHLPELLLLSSHPPNLAPTSPTVHPPRPPPRGCCCYLYDLKIMFMHKWDWTHSATRLGPPWTLKSLWTCSLCALTSTTVSP